MHAERAHIEQTIGQARSRELDLFLQPHLNKRLVRHIAGIGRRLDGIEQVLGQPQRDGLREGLRLGNTARRALDQST